ncbi:MAG TPA: hypothetical protein VLT86_15230 [Vicinamibacterales bacterium]|nr:hypothetical protein [Vicinamibacterales bacterium]
MTGHRRAFLGGVVLLAGATSLAGRAQQSPPAQPPARVPVAPGTPMASANAPGPEFFNGNWDYNPDFSVDAATGRLEQNPRGANARRTSPGGTSRPGSTGGGPAGGGGTNGGATYPGGAGGSPVGGGTSGYPGGGFGGTGGGYGGGYGGGGYGGGYGPTPNALAYLEQQDLLRDLLEVPEKLFIKVLPDSVSFTDDLDRERTYLTSGKKQHYQLGAASYDAKAHWDGHQLVKEIEGPRGFKMHETYFLSEDGKRMFVIVRVGDPPKEKDKDARVFGFNRVYDRIDQ